MNVELIVDSTVDVPEHIHSRLTVVPLTIHFGQEEYLDGITLDKHRFYDTSGGKRRAAHHQPGQPRRL
mgnify:CR=1 FL=1